MLSFEDGLYRDTLAVRFHQVSIENDRMLRVQPLPVPGDGLLVEGKNEIESIPADSRYPVLSL